MNTPATDATKPERTPPKPKNAYVRLIRATTNRQGGSILEIPMSGFGPLLIQAHDKESLAILKSVDIFVHDGGKFYAGDVPMTPDCDYDVDWQIEVSPTTSGWRLSAARQCKIDAKEAAGLTDAAFAKAWEQATKIVPPLKVVERDPQVWFPRVERIIAQFYVENGFDADKGKAAASALVELGVANRACGDVTYIQNNLKKRLREDFPGGAPVTTSKFDAEGEAADIGLMIIDSMKTRQPSRYGSGPALETTILGDSAVKFVNSAKRHKLAKEMVEQFFRDYDSETKLLAGIATVEGECSDVSASDRKAILKGVLSTYEADNTLEVVQDPDYDESVFLASYKSALEAFKVKDEPKFENGIKGKSDDETLAALKKADIADETPSPDVPVKEQPVVPSAPPPLNPVEAPTLKFTLQEWTKWLTDQKQDYSELKPADIMSILGITKASDFTGTLKDAAEKLKRAVEVRRADALLDDAKRILKDKGVPLDEWPKIIAEAGDPKLFTDTSYSKTNYQGKVLTLANAYIVTTSAPKPESALLPVNPESEKAIVQVQPPSYGILTALKFPTPAEMQVMTQLAEAIVASALFRGVDSVPRAIAIMLKALQMGIGAIEAFENVWVIPSKKGDQLYPSTNLLRGRVMAHPVCKRFDVVGDEKKATAIVWRAGDTEPVSFTYTIEEAKAAGLLETWDSGDLKKQNWNSPKAMLQHRVGRLAVMSKFPDVAIGLLPPGDEDAA